MVSSAACVIRSILSLTKLVRWSVAVVACRAMNRDQKQYPAFAIPQLLIGAFARLANEIAHCRDRNFREIEP